MIRFILCTLFHWRHHERRGSDYAWVKLFCTRCGRKFYRQRQ